MVQKSFSWSRISIKKNLIHPEDDEKNSKVFHVFVFFLLYVFIYPNFQGVNMQKKSFRNHHL